MVIKENKILKEWIFFVKGPHWWMVKTERKRVETIRIEEELPSCYFCESEESKGMA